MKALALAILLSLCLCTAYSLDATTHLSRGRSPEEWKSRIIYQLLTDRFNKPNATSQCNNLRTYCGGTYNGIIQKLDYIQSLGMNAIWITPIVTNTEGSYHGYHAVDLYGLNEHFGTENDLKRLISECHKRDIWVMLDVVANHMGSLNDFSKFYPFNSTDHYHFPRCDINDWNNQVEVENCWLAGLPDLKQENAFVANALITWIQYMTKTYDFDGYRVDTVCEVPKSFWTRFQNEGAPNTLMIGEILNGNTEYVAGYQGPLTSVLSYPMYFVMRNVFAYKHSMYELSNQIQLEPSKYRDPSVLGLFIDNHDNKRFLNINSDWAQYYNALIYMFSARGIPIVYYGAEEAFSGGDDPANRESLWPWFNNVNHPMFKMIQTLSRVRQQYKLAYEDSSDILWVNDQCLVIGRGSKALVVLSNIGSGHQYIIRDISVYKMKEGTKLCDVFNPSNSVTIQGGKVTITVENGTGSIYVPC